jgi:hypothetical protein
MALWPFIVEAQIVQFSGAQSTLSIPVVTAKSLAGSSPASTSDILHDLGVANSANILASNSPTSCAITGGDPSNYFACNVVAASLQISFTSAGASNYAGAVEAASQTLTVTATNAAGTSSGASIPVTVYADGYKSAPTVVGGAQFPSILSGYTTRPPWLVAGVDYPVSYPSATSFLDPNVNTLPTGCGKGTFQIICNSGSPTLNGWDFSLEGGWQVICEGGTLLTITNSKFAIGANGQATINATSGCASLTITYSSINGNALPDNLNGTLIDFSGSGTLTIEYNYWINGGGDWVDQNKGTLVEKYNLCYSCSGQGSGSHGDWLQTNGNVTYNEIVTWNTVYQAGLGSGLGTQGFGINGTTQASAFLITNCELGRNTVVTLSGVQVNYAFSFGTADTTINTACSLHDNYIDLTGTTVFAHADTTAPPGTIVGSGSATASNNTNMVTGATLGTSW